MAFQFIHLETYSRKADKSGRSVSWVLDEAERCPGAAPHVQSPQPPVVVYGCSIDEVRRRHDEAVAGARVTLANGRTRAVRADQKTLGTVVASHPATMEQMRSDPRVRADVEGWETRTVAWLKDRYGDDLASVVRHEDEGHPHLHAYLLPADLRASRLHPGAEAKRSVKEAGPQPGEDAKALSRRGDVAYKRAMREWQDSYWQVVGLPCGLTRLGPGRRRLSREEWRTEQAAVASVKAAQEKAAKIRRRADEVVSETKKQARGIVSEAEAVKAAALLEAEEAKRLHDVAEKREQDARNLLSRTRAEASRILASAHAEVSRAMTWGGRLRGFLDGFRRSAIEEAARRAAAADVERERCRADELDQRVRDEAQKRREAEDRADNAALSARGAGRDRDRARQALGAVRDLEETITHDWKGGA